MGALRGRLRRPVPDTRPDWADEGPAGNAGGGKLDVVVLFTTVAATLGALRSAARLAHGLNTRIRLLVPHVVAYPLSIDAPAVPQAWLARRFRTLAEQASVETAVEICLCRDRRDAVRSTLRPGSLVVIGGRRRWWPTREQRMATQLQNEGFSVVLTESK